MKTARATAVWIGGGVVIAAVALIAAKIARDDVQCDAGFVRERTRCVLAAGAAPPPERRVRIAAARFTVGPSDWEAEGRVPARTVETRPFEIDAYEAHGQDGVPLASMTLAEARAFCTLRGGRLPSEDEWIAAASSGAPNGAASRYPWGDTGAVCRRAAWGVARGPCASGGDGPGAVGAHASGATALGVHDMAGGVAEWVEPSPQEAAARPDLGVAHGGSWASALATELRTWSRLELAKTAKDPRVGVRCAYDVPP
jgi:formylglycine-generating enzyme required for sulfatase activity